MAITEEDLGNWSRALCRAFDTADGNRPSLDCLSVANQQAQNPEFQRVVNAVKDVVAMGFSLSGALGLFPTYFDADYRTIVRYGEMYGELDVTLKRFVERPEDRAPRGRKPEQETA